MSHIDAVSLHNELNRLSSVIERRDDFHRFLEQAPSSCPVSGEVSVLDGAISVKVLGHTITAVPRPVKTSSAFAIEYKFTVSFNGEYLPIWYIYLWESGVLTEYQSIESARVCDFNNQYVKRHLVLSVTNALLQSLVFQPSVGGAAS